MHLYLGLRLVFQIFSLITSSFENTSDFEEMALTGRKQQLYLMRVGFGAVLRRFQHFSKHVLSLDVPGCLSYMILFNFDNLVRQSVFGYMKGLSSITPSVSFSECW